MLISVCIPTYSRLTYLQLAVNSVFAQTCKAFEVCVALDPKPDGPDQDIQRWCALYAAKNPAFRYTVNEKNAGLAGNWNVLANMAKGEYLMIIGDDDTLEPEYLEQVTKNLERFNPDVVFCDQNFIDAEGKIEVELTEKMAADYHRKELPAGLVRHPVELVLNNSVPMSSAIIKREHVLHYPFDSSLNTPELEVFLKIAVAGGIFEYTDQRLANYRVHPESATSGGLKLHYLLRNLIPIHVPLADEHLKYNLISARIIPAINICIREGNKKLADMLLKSGYYPVKKKHLKVIQSLLLICPPFLIRRIL